jgi:hypothetical protein
MAVVISQEGEKAMGQRSILIVAALLLVLAVLFPPAYLTDLESYSFIYLLGEFDGRIELDMLIAEVFAIALLCSLARIYVKQARLLRDGLGARAAGRG